MLSLSCTNLLVHKGIHTAFYFTQSSLSLISYESQWLNDLGSKKLVLFREVLEEDGAQGSAGGKER